MCRATGFADAVHFAADVPEIHRSEPAAWRNAGKLIMIPQRIRT